jgi:hypothetical protein
VRDQPGGCPNTWTWCQLWSLLARVDIVRRQAGNAGPSLWIWGIPASLLDELLDGVELAGCVRAYALEAMMSYHDEEHVLYLLAKLNPPDIGPRLFPKPATSRL